MRRLAPKIVIWLMLAVIAWVIVAALRHKATASSSVLPHTSTTDFADPLRSYREPFRAYRELSRTIGSDPKVHSNHPKASNRPVAPVSESVKLERDDDELVRLTWEALVATPIANNGRPAFPVALKQVDGERVRLVGYMTPLDDYGLVDVFLLVASPVSCFYCQSPGPTGIVAVSLSGPAARMSLEPVEVEGTLRLNADDPEDFLFAIESAVHRVDPR